MANNPTERIHSSDSALRHPLWLLQTMGRDLCGCWGLAWRLLIRDINARYRQSYLGIAWAFIPPLVMGLGFSLAKTGKVINLGETDIPYAAYVMFSTILWQTFIEALSGPVQAVSQGRPLIARVYFPREALVLAKLGQVLFNFGIKLIMIVGLFIIFQIPVTGAVVLAPGALLALILLGTLLGALLAPLSLLYQDVSRGLTLVTMPWLLLTPVVYPAPSEGLFATLVAANPVTPLLVTTRELATTGVVSDPLGFWLVGGLTVLGLIPAWIVFRLAMPLAIERISA